MAANLIGQQVNITIPNGAVAVSANDPSGIYLDGGSPFSEWQNFMIWPGGDPRSTGAARAATSQRPISPTRCFRHSEVTAISLQPTTFTAEISDNPQVK